jgi:hypothetical protein
VFNAWRSVLAWARAKQEEEEPNENDKPDFSWDSVYERLDVFNAYINMDAIRREEEAYDHAFHLCMYSATQLRSSVLLPRVEDVDAAFACVGFFASYPPERMLLASVLVAENAKELYAPVWHQEFELAEWRLMYTHLSKHVNSDEGRRLVDIRDKLVALLDVAMNKTQEMPADFAAQLQGVRALIASVQEKLQSSLLGLVGLLSARVDVEDAHARNQGSNPFKNCAFNQKALTRHLSVLTEHAACIQTATQLWTAEGSEASPSLQTMGFSLSFLQDIVKSVQTLIDDSVSSSASAEIEELKLSLVETSKLLEKVPDPDPLIGGAEQRFRSFMRTNGGKLNMQSKELEKVISVFPAFSFILGISSQGCRLSNVRICR